MPRHTRPTKDKRTRIGHYTRVKKRDHHLWK